MTPLPSGPGPGLHAGLPPAPHDVWTAWAPDPVAAVALGVVTLLYAHGRLRTRRPVPASRDAAVAGGLVALLVALVSPLDAASASLASAHMVQHLLLVLVAAPLLVLGAPATTLTLGTPRPVRRTVGRLRASARLTRRTTDLARRPVPAVGLHVGVLWFWHAAGPYQAALDHGAVHALEHATFLGTALLLWGVVVDAARTGRTSPGLGVLLVFGVAMANVFLALLLTFATTPWYPGYAGTTEAWGLTQLMDQQLAGAIMWVPGGVVYAATALVLLVSWLRGSEQPPPTAPARAPSRAGPRRTPVR